MRREKQHLLVVVVDATCALGLTQFVVKIRGHHSQADQYTDTATAVPIVSIAKENGVGFQHKIFISLNHQIFVGGFDFG
jgi:hypothetical protein